MFFCVNLFPCRREFDLANQEAMDESAEWRRMFDLEFDKSAKCSRELDKVCKLIFQLNILNAFCMTCLFGFIDLLFWKECTQLRVIKL